MWTQFLLLVVISCSAANEEDEEMTPSHKDMFWELAKVRKNTGRVREQYTVPPLPFDFKDMEPYIDAETMELHYEVIFKDHAIRLNDALKKWRSLKNDKSGIAKKNLLEIWRNRQKIPEDGSIRRDFYHFGGGYINHIIYFSTMSPNSENVERGYSEKMARLIDHSFHGYGEMKRDIDNAAADIYGPGWVYVCRATNPSGDKEYLTVVPSEDEAPPLDNKQLYPILALDLWEHAYFKKYGTDKQGYIDNWWKTVDWIKVERLLNWWRMVYPDGYGEHMEL